MAAWSEERKAAAKESYKNKMNFLHKIEDFNGEKTPEIVDTGLGFQMSAPEKLQSAINTLKILPPSMLFEGRHRIENVQAINCFKVTEAMLDEIYSNHKHDEYGQLVKV